MRGFLRFVSEWKTAASLSFTAAAVIYAAVSLLYGEETVGIGKLLSLLLVCALGSAIQYLCFTDNILKKMRYTRRALLFLVLFVFRFFFCFFSLLCLILLQILLLLLFIVFLVF